MTAINNIVEWNPRPWTVVKHKAVGSPDQNTIQIKNAIGESITWQGDPAMVAILMEAAAFCIDDNTIIVKQDGDAWMACYGSFENLAESQAAFGKSPLEAVGRLTKTHDRLRIALTDLIDACEVLEGGARAPHEDQLTYELALRQAKTALTTIL